MSESSNGKLPVHLTQLPIKSTQVAPGDVVGGMVYIMDKPFGVEEGMIGISIDSPAYRAFIKTKLEELKKEGSSNSPSVLKTTYDDFIKNYLGDKNNEEELITAMIKDSRHTKHNYRLKSSELKKIFFSFGKLHEVNAFRTYYKNVGMGGLLFAEYKKSLEVKENDSPATQIGKINGAGVDNRDKVRMVKQDGVLVNGRTGPGVRRILKTEVGRKFQILANPFIVLATGGLSALAFGALTLGWRAALLSRGTIATVNSDAIVETLATKIANIRGFESQEIETIKGSYGAKAPPKIATIVTWSTGCNDLSGKLAGGEENKTNVIVCCDENKKHIKVDKENNIIRAIPDKKNKGQFIYKKGDKIVKKEVYDKAFSVSEERIAGLGESLASFICLGDRDGIGEVGQNKVTKPLNPPNGKFTHQFFGIDFGKAYEKQNPIMETLQDDFSFKNPKARKERFLNISILYDCPLREKMKGIYLMAALRGKLTDEQKNAIVTEFRKMGDTAFADKLEGYPESLMEKYGAELSRILTWTQNGDLFLIKKEENKYRHLAGVSGISKEEKKHYLAYADRLGGIYKTAKETDDKIFKIFAQRMILTPSQIDLLDNLEKLTAKKAHILSPDGKVLLNHIRIESEERVPWQLEVINNGAGAGAGAVEQFKLTCGSKDTTILDKLNSIPELESMLEKSNGVMSYKNDQIVVVLNKTQLTFLTRILTEDKVAEVRKLASFRTEKQKEDFYKKLETNNAAPEKTVAPAEPAPKTVNEVAQLSKPGKNVLFKDKYKQAQSNLTLKDKPPRRHDINRSKHKPGGK